MHSFQKKAASSPGSQKTSSNLSVLSNLSAFSKPPVGAAFQRGLDVQPLGGELAAEGIRLSQKGDPEEQEADRVAEQVMQGSILSTPNNPPVKAAEFGCSMGGACAAFSRGGGSPLPDSLQSFYSSRMNHDFSQVRLHTDSRAAAQAQGLNARAFTQGNHIAFANNEYQPGTAAGKRLLAHELAHTVQQRERSSLSPPLIQRDLVEEIGAGYRSMKESAYESIIANVGAAKIEAVNGLRQLAADSLPASLQSVANKVVDVFEGCLDIAISFGYAVLGLVVGLAEGVVGILHGIAKLLYGVIKYVVLTVRALFGDPQALEAYQEEILESLANLPTALKAFFDGWLEKFKKASPERQTLMIGELTGQVLALIGSFGVAAGKAGNIPKLSVPVPATVVTPAGELMTVTAGVSVAVGEPAVAAGMTGVSMAMISNGDGGGAPESSTRKPRPDKSKAQVNYIESKGNVEIRGIVKGKDLGNTPFGQYLADRVLQLVPADKVSRLKNIIYPNITSGRVVNGRPSGLFHTLRNAKQAGMSDAALGPLVRDSYFGSMTNVMAEKLGLAMDWSKVMVMDNGSSFGVIVPFR